MSAIEAPRPETASSFLFGSEKEAQNASTNLLGEHGEPTKLREALSTVPSPVLPAIRSAMAKLISDLFGFDLIDAVAEGWRTYDRLTTAAENTARSSKSEVVPLSTHRISSVHRPYIDIFIKEELVAKLQFELTVTFRIDAVSATVTGGRLVSLQAGPCDVTATLVAEGRQIASQTGQLELPLQVSLGDGIRLLASAPTAS